MKITKSFSPSNLADWRNWLAQNHDREQEVWLVYLKAARGQTNIDYESSVEEALCFGWIDSIIQKIDEEKYARKFNPRRKDSKWSETNKRRVLKVIREGRMTQAGMAKVTFDVKEVDPSKPKPRRYRLTLQSCFPRQRNRPPVSHREETLHTDHSDLRT